MLAADSFRWIGPVRMCRFFRQAEIPTLYGYIYHRNEALNILIETVEWIMQIPPFKGILSDKNAVDGFGPHHRRFRKGKRENYP